MSNSRDHSPIGGGGSSLGGGTSSMTNSFQNKLHKKSASISSKYDLENFESFNSAKARRQRVTSILKNVSGEPLPTGPPLNAGDGSQPFF
jgi:hypothetical protein